MADAEPVQLGQQRRLSTGGMRLPVPDQARPPLRQGLAGVACRRRRRGLELHQGGALPGEVAQRRIQAAGRGRCRRQQRQEQADGRGQAAEFMRTAH